MRQQATYVTGDPEYNNSVIFIIKIFYFCKYRTQIINEFEERDLLHFK